VSAGLTPGPNPTILSYNASAVKIYATGSLACFENKKKISTGMKYYSSLLKRWRCKCKFRSRRIGPRFCCRVSAKSLNGSAASTPAKGSLSPASIRKSQQTPLRQLALNGRLIRVNLINCFIPVSI
jgi:hypothetical protein